MTKQNHEVLSLNAKRAYVLVNGTWYDTSKELYPQVGANFLTGMIDQILSFEEYAQMFPESKTELLIKASDKIPAGSFAQTNNPTPFLSKTQFSFSANLKIRFLLLV